MRTVWDGYYLDGRNAARHRAVIRLLRTGLEVNTENGATTSWPYGETRQTQGSYAGQEIRLERGGEYPEVLLIGDPAFLTSLHRLAPEIAGQFHDPDRRGARVGLTALAALAVIGLTAALYVWGIPGLAAVVAPYVPTSWEARLGRTVSEHLAPPNRRCVEATGMQAIRDITETLLAPAQNSPYTFRVIVANNPSVNALAAPGGYVVVFRGLLEATQSAEELAGVLAHEFQHILLRHSTRALLRYASTGLLVAAVTGDVSGAMAFGVEGARLLGELRYSRQDEEEADREGLRMLVDAGVDPAGMIAFFETLEHRQGAAPTLPAYLSSHPTTESRIQRLRRLTPTPPADTTRLLPVLDWREVRRLCGATRPVGR